MTTIVSVWVPGVPPRGAVFCAQITYFQELTTYTSLQITHFKWLAAKILVFNALTVFLSRTCMKKPGLRRVFLYLLSIAGGGELVRRVYLLVCYGVRRLLGLTDQIIRLRADVCWGGCESQTSGELRD
jgi:hypothetical protein